MLNKWYVLLLGLIVSQGSLVVAMEKVESPRTPQRNLACSTEAREICKKTTALNVSAEKRRREEKGADSNVYHPYCGSIGNTPPDDQYGRRGASDSKRGPIPYWSDFPGH